jgi:hypothetical protein
LIVHAIVGRVAVSTDADGYDVLAEQIAIRWSYAAFMALSDRVGMGCTF